MTEKQPMATCASGQIVSFDLFDTLVSRDVMRPIDVFKIVEREATSQGLVVEGFAADRRAAELEALCVMRRGLTIFTIVFRLDTRKVFARPSKDWSSPLSCVSADREKTGWSSIGRRSCQATV